MGTTALALRCVRCKVVAPRDVGRRLEVLGHEVAVVPCRSRRENGAPASHRAVVRCLDCGHVTRTTHPSVAVSVWEAGRRPT